MARDDTHIGQATAANRRAENLLQTPPSRKQPGAYRTFSLQCYSRSGRVSSQTLKGVSKGETNYHNYTMGMLHGQDCKEPPSEKDAALPVRPNATEHPLSGWAVNAFIRAGIHTVGELAERSADELLSLPNFGADSLRRTEAFLAQLGLELSEVPSRGPAPNTTQGLSTVYSRIDPDIEERLHSAGLWEGSASGRLVPGTKLRDLLRTSALSQDSDLDALLTTLGAGRLLPRPASMNDFLAFACRLGRREKGDGSS